MRRTGLKHSGRRAFLRGAGGSMLMLPLLEYTHGRAWAAGDGSWRRFLTVFSHGGEVSNQPKAESYLRHDGSGTENGVDLWRPADASSEALVLGPIHEALEPWRQKLLQLEGIDNNAAVGQDPYGIGSHGFANVTALTAADITIANAGTDDEEQISLGPSIDQVIAERLAARQPVPFDRIHLTVSGHQYGSPYYRASQERVGGESSPVEAFANLFAGVTGGELTADQVRQIAMRGSMLDGLLEGYHAANKEVGAHDRHVIDAHLDHLRALEQELLNPVVCTPPAGIDVDADQPGNIVGPQHAELIVAAIRCGLTNVANLEIADIVTPWTPTGTPMPSGYEIGHSLGHFADSTGASGENASLHQTWLDEMADNRRWRISLLAQILEGLDDPGFPEGDGTLLDSSVVLYTSEFREPAGHAARNVPILLAGSGGGCFATGRFIDYNDHYTPGNPDTLEYASSQSNHNLFVSILNAMDEPDTEFGSDHADHQGPLPGLTA